MEIASRRPVADASAQCQESDWPRTEHQGGQAQAQPMHRGFVSLEWQTGLMDRLAALRIDEQQRNDLVQHLMLLTSMVEIEGPPGPPTSTFQPYRPGQGQGGGP